MTDKLPYDKIEDYLNGNLEEKEITAFEQLINTSEEAKAELELYKSIRIAQMDDGLSLLEEKLLETEKKYFIKQNSARKKRIPVFWIKRLVAASIILFIIFYFTNKSIHSQQVDPTKLYTEFAQHDFSFQEMNDKNNLYIIQKSLEKRKYKEALSIINNYLNNNPETADFILTKGIAMLELDQFNNAHETFNKLHRVYPLYQSESNWYIALTFLKQNKITDSISTLTRIPKESSRYSEAQRLKDQLEKINLDNPRN